MKTTARGVTDPVSAATGATGASSASAIASADAADDATDDAMLDVLIVGAGLSGIGAAHHLQQRCPDRRYAIVEARGAIGGTWDLFRYPGVRSDSDMYTLGYSFKPWRQTKAIADGASILAYIRETADEAGITPRIRFGHAVRRASWSSEDACWSVDIERTRTSTGTETGTMTKTETETETGTGMSEPVRLRARFLYLCSGYYSYAGGHRPTFEGERDYQGTLVEPQFWPVELDYAGKRVVVIGSGATAVTLVPEMARTAAHVTMLQRSPTYIVNRPSEDRIALGLNRCVPAAAAYAITRWKNVLGDSFLYRLARRRPALVRRRIVEMASRQLAPGFDVATHFTPRYDPWDQRICVVPDGDLFAAMREGRASVVTDSPDRFTADGIRLAGGDVLKADIVVMATGLELNVLGDIAISIDGKPLDVGASMAYKGMMLGDVPNLAMAFGYTNASWTLKADLTAAYVCRLLRFMQRRGYQVAVPMRDPTQAPQPILSFTSGYVQRAVHRLPRQGTKSPWQVHQNYLRDLPLTRWSRIDDGVMRFGAAALRSKPTNPSIRS